ncbi:MAG: hypothetical protein JWN54_3493 [Mycobacterium sp.]|nr:hypothetical protein [Mycobacterium sp.]
MRRRAASPVAARRLPSSARLARTPRWQTGPVIDPPAPPEAAVCSARGCHEAARWVLAWNNPRLHTPDRRKTWAACDVHRETLSDFLTARGFLREVTPLS